MKKVAIIGAGISGLFVANLFKENPDYQVTIYEKNSLINLDEGYGIQLSTNSIKLLNRIGFNTLKNKDRFNPKKIDFYTIKKEKKICDLNISEFNSEDCKYTTLKRSKLVEFLKDKLDDNMIKYNHNIEKIEKNNDQINLTFNKNNKVICDYLVISDGVFSKCKSLISNDEIKPAYNNSIAIRGNISKNKLHHLNENNISLFMGHNFHYVIYRLNKENEKFNFIGVLKYQLTANELDNYGLFKEESFIRGIKYKLQNKISANILENLNNIKYFPVFVSKSYLKPGNNIFLVGDAFFAFPPSFAQGASQSIESGSELFNSIINKKNDFYNDRVVKVKMINNRSKLNEFVFHVSNPIIVFFRNLSLKILTKNKKFLENYLGKIYK
ncbi:FAD-dependent monooxygenase [Candidatus Pelagibacter sp.]|nr:NAD(P)/FAD-dependent oxidoreductase [Candidatus Pelagibacter sp.]MDA9594688.1 FAD-dependent monooxygenase [Candidatus Pelagibacter sp.]